MNLLLKILIPLAILAIGVAGAVAMIMARPQPETRIPEVLPPLVRVEPVERRDVRFSVHSQGTVSPRTESVLVPEVAGRVTAVAPSFASGGFFEQGDVLVEIEPDDYRQAVVMAEAEVARAELQLARVGAEAEVAIREWGELEGGEAPALTRYEPQLAEARAAVNAAQASLTRARRNLERTRVRAPYAGRVRQKQVDRGQYVAPGTPLATVYAVDWVEVRLPIPNAELRYLDLPLDYRGEERRRGPEVILRADFAGTEHEWRGRVVRTEGEIDPKSRMVHVVARVADPYGRGDAADRPPLAVGMYVRAEILGRVAEDVVVLPRSALRDDGRLLVVDAELRLRFRDVELLRSTDRDVILRSGVEAGERVCVSPLAVVTDGMQVRLAAEAETGEATS